MKKSTAIWITVVVIITALLLTSLILWIVLWAYINNYDNAFYGAIVSTSACISDPNICASLDIDPPVPTAFPASFSPEIALFVGNLNYLFESNGFDTSGNFSSSNFILPDSLQLLGYLNTDETAAGSVIGFVAYDPTNRVQYVCLRGTITPEEWQMDFRYQQMELTEFNTASSVYFECGDGTLVHQGFFDIFDEFQLQLGTLVQSKLDDTDNIVLFGHSLGAALAQLSMLYLGSNITNKPMLCYSYGGPRVGSFGYADCMNTNFPNRIYRLQNESDVVPVLPLSAMPNISDPSTPLIFENAGESINYNLNYGGLRLNHSMKNYITYLQTL